MVLPTGADPIDERGNVTRQIARHVAADVARGVLRPGEPLPSVEDLARTLMVSPRRVRAALESLLDDEVLAESEGGARRVADGGDARARALVCAHLRHDVEALVERARHGSGCTAAEVAAALRDAAGRLEADAGPEGEERR